MIRVWWHTNSSRETKKNLAKLHRILFGHKVKANLKRPPSKTRGKGELVFVDGNYYYTYDGILGGYKNGMFVYYPSVERIANGYYQISEDIREKVEKALKDCNIPYGFEPTGSEPSRRADWWRK